MKREILSGSKLIWIKVLIVNKNVMKFGSFNYFGVGTDDI